MLSVSGNLKRCHRENSKVRKCQDGRIWGFTRGSRTYDFYPRDWSSRPFWCQELFPEPHLNLTKCLWQVPQGAWHNMWQLGLEPAGTFAWNRLSKIAVFCFWGFFSCSVVFSLTQCGSTISSSADISSRRILQSGSMVVQSQQEGSIRAWAFLCGVFMFSPCLPGDSKLPIDVKDRKSVV